MDINTVNQFGQTTVVMEYRVVVEGKTGKEIATELLNNKELTSIHKELGEEHANGVTLYVSTLINAISASHQAIGPHLKTFVGYEATNIVITNNKVMFIRCAKKAGSNQDVHATSSVLNQAKGMFEE